MGRRPRENDASAGLERAFARVEASLGTLSSPQRRRGLAELRALAEADQAPPELRLRFARRWLSDRGGGDRITDVRNDRAAYLWSVQGAHRNDPQAQLLLGHCYRQGRGASSDPGRARQWYQRAADAGSSEARFWLRYGRPRERWLVYRGPWLTVAGLVLLAVHALVGDDPGLSLFGVAVFLLLQTGIQLLARMVLFRGSADAVQHDGWSSGRLIAYLRRRPWRLLLAVAEDGLCLVPVLWLGVSPWTALLAGAAFGFLHYPTFSWRSCLAKGIDYFVTTLLFLPVFGLWTVAVGHVVFDALVLVMATRARPRT